MNTIDEAAAALEAAKIAEAAATAKRIDAEQVVLRLMESKTEGSVTARGVKYKVTATFGISRTLDPATLESVRGRLAPDVFDQVIEYAPKLRTAGLRDLQKQRPDAYAVLSEAITAKPAKPSVKVEALVQQPEEEAA